MKATTFKAAVLAGSLGLIAGSASGQGLSDPVGYRTKTLQGASDTSLAPGLLRPEFGSVTITTVAGSVAGINETLTASELDAPASASGSVIFEHDSNNPNFGDDYFMLLVTSGPSLGSWYAIVSNGANDITLDLMGDVVGTDLDGASAKVIPMWDLRSLFTDGAGLIPSAVPFNGSRIFFNDLTTAGVNLVRTEQYVYVDGALLGQPTFTGFYNGAVSPVPGVTINVAIFPDEHLIIRHPAGSSDTSLTVTGDVLVDSLRISLVNQGDPGGQDIAIGIPYPVGLTLDDLGIADIPANGFQGFTNSSVPFSGDRLFFYDDATAGVNKPLVENYVHVDGSLFGQPTFTGWYDGNVAPNPANRVGDTAGLVEGGRGAMIRKPAGSTSGDWVFTSPYTP